MIYFLSYSADNRRYFLSYYMYFLIYILHQIICSMGPQVTGMALLHFNNRILLLFTTFIYIIWYYTLDSEIEISPCAIIRAILLIMTNVLYSRIIGFLPTPQVLLMFDFTGFFLSLLTILTGIENSPNTLSTILLVVNSGICLWFHRHYISYTIPIMILTCLNNLLFKYRKGNNNFIYTAFILTFFLTLAQILFFDIKNLSITNITSSVSYIHYFIIYVVYTFIARLSYIYALKTNTTTTINFLRLLKTSIVSLFVNKKYNPLSFILLLGSLVIIL